MVQKHLHTYQRVKGKRDVYKCIHPDCTHFTQKELIVGKRADCPFCHNSFVLSKEALRLAKPHCSTCVVRPDKRKFKPTMTDSISENLKRFLLEEEKVGS